jgi:hypothetical protein
MPRALAIDVSGDLPVRARGLADHAMSQLFGGCVAQGSPCTSVNDCCQVPLAPGDYVLCYFYRSGHGTAHGYCTRSFVVYGR